MAREETPDPWAPRHAVRLLEDLEATLEEVSWTCDLLTGRLLRDCADQLTARRHQLEHQQRSLEELLGE